jgi:hypothetical protein
LSDDGRVLDYRGNSGYKEDGTNGQVMVEIPKFYYKVENDGNRRFYICESELDGFKIHPAFVSNSVEYEKIYFSAFEGSVYDTSATAYLLNDQQIADFTATTGDKLSSIAGAKPASGLTQALTIVNSRILAQNRGSRWHNQLFLPTCAVQLLYLVEYANFNTQSMIGSGVTAKASGTGNESEITGYTSFLGNASGRANVLGSGATGLNSVSYRGIENFWGNIYTWVDGYNVNDRIGYVADHGFESGKVTSPYTQVDWTNSLVNGYVSDIGYTTTHDYMFIATVASGGSTTYLTDNYYQSTGARVALFGGLWINSASAGGFLFALNDASSVSYRGVGARLAFI